MLMRPPREETSGTSTEKGQLVDVTEMGPTDFFPEMCAEDVGYIKRD